ncbi:MAG: hypothetical protein ABIH66_02875, partial [bacterium]
MSGVLKKFLGIELKKKEKSRDDEPVVEKKKSSKEVREEKHENAKRRWEYDMRRIQQALHEVDEGKDMEEVLAELNSDLLLSKPVDAEMFHRLAEQRRYS